MTSLIALFRTTAAAAIIATATVAGVAHADIKGEVAKLDPKTNTYCVSTSITGSILPHRVCMTRQDWIDSGATITPASHKQLAVR